MKIEIPKPEELSTYYQSYLKYVTPGDDLLELIRNQKKETENFLSAISEEQASSVYAPGKWQLKEVVGHVCDTERIMCYRALRFSRKDDTPLAGFDENTYIPGSNYSVRSLKNISEELSSVRGATLSLFGNFSPEMIGLKGIANGNEISVRALIFMVYVHQKHHMKVIREKYLS